MRRTQVRALLEAGEASADAVPGHLDSKDAKTRELTVRA
jgi:hypothetical protein